MANPFQGDDVDPFSGARDEEGNIKAPAPKKQNFKQAFADARRMGKDTFMWNGKKYTTELAKPKPKAKATDIGPGSKAGMGRIEDTMSETERRRGPAMEAMNKLASQEGRFGSFKKGGMVKKKIDGCATKGKTRGRMV